jgi:hypothetical protein
MPTTPHSGRTWRPVAGVLLGAGWGSNQFTPVLLIYRSRLGLGTATLEALFGAYALGLIPGLLLVGAWSDAHGRRRVALGSVVLSLLATGCLIAGEHTVSLLLLGRLLAGLGSGAAFGAGTAWLREISLPPFGDATPPSAGRRAAVAMTAGFALGPLVAGLLAQWAPAPAVVAYLPHLALMLAVLGGVRRTPETWRPTPGRPGGHGDSAPRPTHRGFRSVVAPMAPWVFTAPAIAFALLPSIVGASSSADGIALTAAVTALTALAGVLIQPIARRLEAGAPRTHPGVVGLLVLAGGVGLAGWTAHTRQPWLMLPCAILLGTAYGLCLVAGLLEVGRLAGPGRLAGLTAGYYALAYLGFGAPYLLAIAARIATYPVLLLIAAVLALATAAHVHRAYRKDRQGSADVAVADRPRP